MHTKYVTSLLQEAQSVADFKNIPPLLETDDVPKKKMEKFYKAPTSELIAYIDFSVSTTGMLSGVKVTVLSWLQLHINTPYILDVTCSSRQRV